MILYILRVTVLLTACFLFYKLLLQKETFYRLNRWMLVLCLLVSFALPLLPVPQSLSWRANYEAVLLRIFGKVAADHPDLKSRVNMPPGESAEEKDRTHREYVYLNDHSRETKIEEPARSGDASHASTDRTERMDRAPGTERSERTERSTGSTGWNGSNGSTGVGSKQLAAGAGSGNLPGAMSGTTTGPNSLNAANPTPGPSLNTPPNSPPDPSQNTAARQDAVRGSNWALWILGVYIFGVVIFGFNLVLQIAVLLFQTRARPVVRDGRFLIVEVNGDRAPCSFGNRIFINRQAYDPETYQQILIHEKIHVCGRHSVDILLAELVLVLQWFNPFAWLYRKEVENNLEFLTDQSVLQHHEVERSAYQLSLLRVSAPHLPFSITTNYNQSLLKRRIVMMNSKRSSLRTVWKYFFLLPLLTGLVCALNNPVVKGQDMPPAPPTPSATPSAPAKAGMVSPVKIADRLPAPAADLATPEAYIGLPTPVEIYDTTPGPGKRAKKATRSDEDFNFSLDYYYNLTAPVAPVVAPMVLVDPVVTVSNTTPMAAPVVAPMITVDPMVTFPNVTPMVAPVVAPAIGVDVWPGNEDDSDFYQGSWFATTEKGKICLDLKSGEDNHHWNNNFCIEKSELSTPLGQGKVEFKLVREAGTITFTGQFDGEQGYGHYVFTPDAAFEKFMKAQGFDDMKPHDLVSFFMINLKKDYVTMIKRYFPDIAKHNLIAMSAMQIDKDYIQYWKDAGYPDLKEHDLISLKALKIDREYVQEIKAAGYPDLPQHQLVSFRAMKIDGAYIRSVKAANKGNLPSANDLISYKAMKIDSNYVAELAKVGYANLPFHDLSSMQALHVSPEYIKSLQAMGYKDIPVHTLVALCAMKIDADYIKGWKDAGYGDIELNEFQSLKAMKVTPDFVKEFQKIGFDHIPIHQLTSLKAMGITADYVSKMREKGFKSNDLQKYIQLKHSTEAFN